MKHTVPISRNQFDLWLQYLRSGNFKQTQERLKHVESDGGCSHCCLGVLCEVMEYGQIHNDDYVMFVSGGREFGRILPFDYSSKFSHNGCLPKFSDWSSEQRQKFKKVLDHYVERSRYEVCGVAATVDIHETSLAELNDTGKFSFVEIADIVESFFEPQDKG